MRILVALSLLVAVALPSSIAAAQTPPVVVIGPPPASAGPPPQVAPAVPPGYEIEGDLGGMHFRARVTTPQPQPVAPPPVMAPPPVVVAPPPSAPVMVVQPQTYAQPTYAQTYAQPTYAQTYAQPTYAQPAYPQLGMQPRDARPRLDGGMDFGARLAFEVLGAGVGFGLATGLGYLVNSNARDDGFMITTLLTSAGLVPTGISVFGGAIAGGRGRFGGAMLGEIIGGGLATLVLVAGDLNLRDPWEQIAFIAGPAILGAIIGFEAQHGLRTARLERRLEQEEAQLTGLSIVPLAQGNGAMAGLSGTF